MRSDSSMAKKSFHVLRCLAVKRRDNAIKQAHAEYQRDLAEIDELEAKLVPPPRPEWIGMLVIKHAPKGEFTIDDAVAFVSAACPGREITRSAVRKSLYRLSCRRVIDQDGMVYRAK